MSDEFDVIVIGAGPTGEVLAGRTAAAGLRTALIENELVGGECSYWACMPSKTLLRPMSVIAAARRVQGVGEPTLDARTVLASRDEVASNFDDRSQVEWVESSGIELIRGRGELVGDKRVRVGERVLLADKAVVIATGSSPVVPPIDGLDAAATWKSREATSSKHVPRRLVVIGGGTVAVEMAQAWKSLGAEQVTMLVRGDRLVDREEPFASQLLLDSMHEMGIDVRFGIEVERVEDRTVHFEGGSIETDEILIAAGRRANTTDIGLETVGLEPGEPLQVDDRLRVNDWLYAVGDVNGRALLTHMGKYQARLAADSISGKSVDAFADHRAVVGVTFTEPQVASVGLRHARARESMNVREVRVPLSSAAGAHVIGASSGEVQMVVDVDRKVVVGATFVGPEVGEMIHAATVAIVGEVPLDQLWHAVPAFPTVSEVWLRLLESYGL